jgi:succinoglycan biosynthesis transport protein ExoP
VLARQNVNLPYRSASSDLSVAVVHGTPRTDALVDSILHILWRRRRLVVASSIICVLLAGAYLLVATPLYTTTARLMLQRNAPKFIHDGVSQSPVPDNDNYLFTQQQVITSTPVLAAALGTPGVHDIRSLHHRSDALAILRRQVNVEVGKKDELLTISFDSANPADGTLLVGAIVDAYTHFNAGLRRTSDSDMLSVLQDEKAQRDKELADKSKDLLTFGQTHGLNVSDDKSNVTEQRLEGLTQALTAARLETINAQSADDEVAQGLASDPDRAKKVAAFLKSSGSILPSSSDDSIIRQEMLVLKARQVELEQRFMPNNPSVVAVQRRIDQLDIAFAAGVEHRLQVAKQHEADLQRSFDQQQSLSFDQAAQKSEYDRRSAEVATLQKLVETLDNRIKEVALTEDGGIPSVTVIEPPRASDAPTKPESARTLLLALLGGLGLGGALAVVRDWHDPRVGSHHVPVDLGVPILGELPPLTEDYSTITRGQKILIDNGLNVPQVCRMLQNMLDAIGIHGRGSTVLVTSPSAGSGKSTLASNLAIVLASAGKRVLLIDADFRSSAQGRIFGVSGETGLGTLLESPDPMPVTAIHHTGTKYLDIMLPGPTRRNPSEILNGQAFIDVLGDLSERYDHVLIDSPPALTYSDARTMAASCDATLMVVRAGQINRQLFEKAREGMSNVGANVVGVVINSESSETVDHSWNAHPYREPATAHGNGSSQSGLMRTVRSMAAAVDLLR